MRSAIGNLPTSSIRWARAKKAEGSHDSLSPWFRAFRRTIRPIRPERTYDKMSEENKIWRWGGSGARWTRVGTWARKTKRKEGGMCEKTTSQHRSGKRGI